MKVLVTGGCGFIGSQIVDELVRQSHTVLVVDNLSSGHREYCSAPIHVIDITDPGLSAVFMEFGPEVVVHTAAQVMLRRSLDDPIFDATVNILGTINVLDACRKCGAKKVIYTATGGACYGEPLHLPVPESAEKTPLAPYGASKYAAEHYVRIYSKLYGFDHLIFRFGNVYGPRDDPHTGRVISVFLTSMLAGKPGTIFGDGKQTRDFLFSKDIAKVICDNIDKKTKSNAYNLASGTGISVNQIHDALARELNLGFKPNYIEKVEGEVRYIFLDISKAKAELMFKPTSLEHGLRETVDWFKKHYKN